MSDSNDESYVDDFDSADDDILDWIDWVEGNIEDFINFDTHVVKKSRKRLKRRDYWSTPWGLILLDHDVSDIRSRSGKKFRLRFRIPFIIYKDVILKRCVEVNLFGTVHENKVRIPLEFKILIALRILGN